MATIVQAKCPQCQKVLRIPADWLTKKMRCKHCGQTIQPRQTEPAAPAAGPTSPPPARKQPQAVKKPAAPEVVPPAKRTPAPPPASPVVPAAPRMAAPVTPAAPPAHPVAPVAMPVSSPAGGDNVFGDLDTEEPTPRPNRRRRRQRSWLPLMVISFVLIASAGIGIVLAWPTIEAALNSSKETAQKSKENRDTAETRPTLPRATKTRDKEEDSNDKVVTASSSAFPRRALIVSVHNYLYANPTHAGMPGTGGRNIANLKRALNNGLRIPTDQILHLSDNTEKGKERTPIKSVIQEGVSSFLASCRPQDRILLFFIGHCSEVEDEPYLVPVEGELDNAKTLIPLKWFYAELEKCKARQKVFVVDVARFSPTEGRERPGGDPLSAKFEAALKKPPEGVQVWSSCSAEQQSYELEQEAQMGVFLNSLHEALSPSVAGKGFQGKIQKPTDLFPLEQLIPLINRSMEAELKSLKVKQVCQLYGKDRDNGAEYDPKQPAPRAQLPKPPDMTVNPQSRQLVKAVLDEVGVPPVKVSRFDNAVHFDFLPAFPEGTLETYATTNAPEDSKLRPAVAKARAVLVNINKDKDMETLLKILRDGFSVSSTSNEKRFKDDLLRDERKVAKLIGQVMEAEEELLAVSEDRDKESKRWQANYDFMVARIQEQIAYLFEFQSMLGSMRKEFPPREEGQSGWRLASRTDLTGDSNGKRRFTSSRKLLDKIIKDYSGSPWEVLAKREKLTALGLEWKGTK